MFLSITKKIKIEAIKSLYKPILIVNYLFKKGEIANKKEITSEASFFKLYDKKTFFNFPQNSFCLFLNYI